MSRVRKRLVLGCGLGASPRGRLADDGIPVVGLMPSVAGRTWEPFEERILEVEHWVDHDGRMNTWERLRRGSPLLAAVHNSWADLALGADGEACDWPTGSRRPRSRPTPPRPPRRCSGGTWKASPARWSGWPNSLASSSGGCLSRWCTTTSGTTTLPRGEDIIAVTDFDFLGRRPRIDDLALMLYFADEQPFRRSGLSQPRGTQVLSEAPGLRLCTPVGAASLRRRADGATRCTRPTAHVDLRQVGAGAPRPGPRPRRRRRYRCRGRTSTRDPRRSRSLVARLCPVGPVTMNARGDGVF